MPLSVFGDVWLQGSGIDQGSPYVVEAPSGSFAAPVATLQRMVASSPTFQKMVGVESVNAALEFVLLRDATDEPRPIAVVSIGDSHGYDPIAGGSQNYHRARGSLWLYLARDTPEALWVDPVQAELDAASCFGSILDEIVALSGADDPGQPFSFLSLQTPEMVMFEESPEDLWKSLGRFFFCGYSIPWGD